MTFYDKIKWVLGIMLVFGLIVVTNLIDRNNFIRVRDSVVTIYEDRLIANDLIFDLSAAMHQKEMALAVKDSTFFNQRNTALNKTIQGLMARYEQTKLTPEESRVFSDLKTNITSLAKQEEGFEGSGPSKYPKGLEALQDIKSNLADLSKIQLHEGSRQMSISKKAIDTVELFTQIEVYFLVLLAVIIQIIVMYKPRSSRMTIEE